MGTRIHLGGDPMTPPPASPQRQRDHMSVTMPLSQQQQRIWAAEQIDPTSDLFNVPAAYRVTGPLDDDALDRAVRGVMGRHPALRMRFRTGADGIPRQWTGGVPERILDVRA